MPSILKFYTAVIALVFCIVPSLGQKFQPKTFIFNGAPQYSEQDLLAAAGIKRGAIMTSPEMNEHAKALMDSGVFETLSYKFDGVAMTFTLIPATLYDLKLENLPLTPGPELDAALHAKFPLFQGKVPSQGTLLDGVREALQQMLAAKGITAELVATPVSDQKSRGKVSGMGISILSPPVTLGDVQFEGASPELLPQLQALAKDPALHPYSSEDTTVNLEHNLTLFYQDRGYAAVSLRAVRQDTFEVTPDAIRIPYHVSVREGGTYKLGAILLPAGSLVTQDEVSEQLRKVNAKLPGTHARSVWAFLGQRYHSKGYLDFTFTPHANLDEAAGTVNYTVDITPGPVYHLAFVKFDNVDDALRTQLMRAWEMMPGDPFDESYAVLFLLKLQQGNSPLSKQLANVIARSNIMIDSNTHEVNLVIRLEKR